MWKHLIKKETFSEMCTMLQLKSLINRIIVPINPKYYVNAAEDFVEVYYYTLFSQHSFIRFSDFP